MSLSKLSKRAAKLSKEVAPGLPVKKVTPLPKVTKPAVWEFSAHPHHAKRSGTHTDIRLGNPTSGIAHSLVLPKRTALPGPGESALVIPTFDHTIPYMDYFGPISTKYGLGMVEKGRRTQTEVYHADPSDEPGTKLRFNLYEGDFPEEFAVRKDQKGRWFIHNKTQTREKRPDIPAEKPKYKEIDPGKIDVTDDRQSIMPKLDGAHAIIDLKAGRSPRAFSYRVAKRAKTGFIEHTHKMPGMLTKKVPKELDGTVLRAEIVGVKGSDAWERQVKLPAKDLKPLHEVTDRQKLRALTKSMKERGWVGDPVVVDDNLRGLSGSHRIAAAKQLGLEVPALVVGPSSALKGVTDDDSVLKRLAQHNLPTAVRLMERQHPGTPPKVTLGRAIPAEQIGGLLNSKVWASRHAQAEMGVRLKAFPFDVVTHKGKPMSDAPFSEKLKVLREVEKSLADLDLPEIAATPEEKINLLNRVKSKQHPLTEEGLVLVEKDRAATPIKAKFAPDFDVYVRDVHPAVRADTGAAHDRAGSVSYSWEPAGPVVGQVGGFKHDEARDMLANPDKYVGRVAKVKAMKVFKGKGKQPGALFQPRFKEWHMDKSDIEKSAFLDELEKIAESRSYLKDFMAGVDPTGSYTFSYGMRDARKGEGERAARKAVGVVGGTIGGATLVPAVVSSIIGSIKGARGGVRGIASGAVSGFQKPFTVLLRAGSSRKALKKLDSGGKLSKKELDSIGRTLNKLSPDASVLGRALGGDKKSLKDFVSNLEEKVISTQRKLAPEMVREVKRSGNKRVSSFISKLRREATTNAEGKRLDKYERKLTQAVNRESGDAVNWAGKQFEKETSKFLQSDRGREAIRGALLDELRGSGALKVLRKKIGGQAMQFGSGLALGGVIGGGSAYLQHGKGVSVGKVMTPEQVERATR